MISFKSANINISINAQPNVHTEAQQRPEHWIIKSCSWNVWNKNQIAQFHLWSSCGFYNRGFYNCSLRVLQQTVTHLTSYLPLPLSLPPSFLQRTNAPFSACRKGHLTAPSQCERYTVCIHFGSKHSQFHIASFFHTGSCTHRCALDEMKALSAWCSRALLLPFFLLYFTSSLLLSPTPWTSQVSLSRLYLLVAIIPASLPHPNPLS